VTSKLLENEIALCIENDGLQIEAKTVEEAFESTFTTKEKESIHGLTIVKKLVDAHGWKTNSKRRCHRNFLIFFNLCSFQNFV